MVRSERDQVISEHMDVAQQIARRFARRCPPWVSREDLVGAALLGLTEAADRFDATRGEPFLSFAEKRIRGAVQDELRRGDILPRRARQMSRRVASVIAALETEVGTGPSDAQIADRLGVTVDTYQRDLAQLRLVKMEPLPDDGAGTTAPEHSPEQQADRRMSLARVQLAIAGLDRRDAELLAFHYDRDLTYAETGAQMGVTTSRVCQLHGRAIERLRVALAA